MNYCNKCGFKIENNQKFCSHCGKVVNNEENAGIEEDDSAVQEMIVRLNKKKCKYCMSEIDVEATVCPHCRRKQPKQKIKKIYTKKEKILITILILIIVALLFFSIRGIKLISDGLNEFNGTNIGKSKKQIFEEKVNSYLSSSKSQFMTDDSEKDYMCYYIDVGDYTGSVRVEKDSSGDSKLYIWLSDGKYYASGYEDNVKIVKSSNVAPTNCHRY